MADPTPASSNDVRLVTFRVLDEMFARPRTLTLNVYQAVLVRPGEAGQSGLSLTRRDWHRADKRTWEG